MILEELLEAYGAELIQLEKKSVLFNIGTKAKYYYQVKSGKIKMNNFNEDGKEFIQGIFYKGDGFGEPPLFENLAYPAYAETVEDSLILKLDKHSFFKLLKENPDSHLRITQALASRLHYKATMAAEISSENAEHRLLKLIDYFKNHIHQIKPNNKYKVELSRQQMADLTGLRVETVIRAIKILEKKGEILLESHKIIR